MAKTPNIQWFASGYYVCEIDGAADELLQPSVIVDGSWTIKQLHEVLGAAHDDQPDKMLLILAELPQKPMKLETVK